MYLRRKNRTKNIPSNQLFCGTIFDGWEHHLLCFLAAKIKNNVVKLNAVNIKYWELSA
jgi:hypothetical protein